MNTPEIKQFIQKRSELFWYIRKGKKQDIPMMFLVETILIYGDVPDVKELFALIGVKKAAEIFFKQVNSKRNNYPARTAHYFSLFFHRYA